jgi:hypothetical protein
MPKTLSLSKIAHTKDIRRYLQYADREMTESEKKYVLNRIERIMNDKISGISTSEKLDNGKMLVTLDFDEILSLSVNPFGGKQSERIGIMVASQLLHEAAHYKDKTEETSKKIVKKFLERKLKEKPLLLIKLLAEVNEKDC